uniref:Gypsy retrotransposon integrase-like protein 1 n=1 Tax=Maylandia zebra TaxID=106582 RepID=A0A3P9BHC9_9CICH
MSLDLVRSDLTAKLSEASLSENNKDALLNLLSKFSSLFDGQLGRTALTEHAIETGNATPVNLPPYRTSPAKKRVIEEQLKLFAPTSLRGTLLDYYHDHPTAGHLGVSKTLARLRFRFFWPKMAADVKRYVISCSVCQLTKPSQKKAAGLMVPIVPQKPWEYVGVDFVGPLPRTPTGNAYLIVFVDYLTKWVEASAVKEATSQVAAGKFVTDIFARHGTPTYLISDRGSPFVSELFEHVVSALGSVHRLTTAYHPQTNATERVNRTLKTAIRAYVGDKHTSWDKFLPQICFALRTAPHGSTGLTPAMISTHICINIQCFLFYSIYLIIYFPPLLYIGFSSSYFSTFVVQLPNFAVQETAQ